MSPDSTILNVLIRLAEITGSKKLSFTGKLNAILREILEALQVKKASIMLRTGAATLEVVASTNSAIIGVRQSITENTPSAWVVKNKKPLYMDRSSRCDVAVGRFAHYHGAAFFLVPIISNDRVIGVIAVTEKIGADLFRQEDREILLHIVGHVITALENNRLAASLKQSHAVLRRKNLELGRLEKLRAELFNMLIHDLKGPLSEIVANLDILSYTVAGDNITFVETAKNGCDTLYNMISNLLDISRLEEGRLPLLYEAIAPQELIREALARLIVSVRLKELTFAEACPAGSDAVCEADRTLLLRILQNLLTNAIQHSPRGETVTIGFRAGASDAIEFFVQDNGPGIPEEHRAAIFEKYTQFNRRTDGRMYTAGLGLAFCKMAVGAHGGSIGVHCDGRSGSTFFFTIPRKKKRRVSRSQQKKPVKKL